MSSFKDERVIIYCVLGFILCGFIFAYITNIKSKDDLWLNLLTETGGVILTFGLVETLLRKRRRRKIIEININRAKAIKVNLCMMITDILYLFDENMDWEKDSALELFQKDEFRNNLAQEIKKKFLNTKKEDNIYEDFLGDLKFTSDVIMKIIYDIYPTINPEVYERVSSIKHICNSKGRTFRNPHTTKRFFEDMLYVKVKAENNKLAVDDE